MSQDLNELTKAIPGVVYQFQIKVDGSWQFCYLSDGIQELYELSPEAVYADCNVLRLCILEEDRASHRTSLELANKNLSPWMHEHRICTPSGIFKWVRGQALPKLQQDGSVLWSGILLDITDSKKTELHLLRLQKIHTAVLKADKLISKTRILPVAFKGICKIAVEFGGMKMAWIGIPNRLNEHILSIASYGEGTGYLDNIFISTQADVPEGRGPVGTAFRENRTVLNQNFKSDLMTRPWQERANAFGWNSVASFPIQRAGEPYAVLTVYAPEINAFDDEAVSLLEELANDISRAVDALDLELERQALARQNKQSEEIFKTLFQTVHQGVVYQNPNGQIITANFAAERILGLSLDTMLGITSLDPLWQAIHLDGTPFPGETHPAMVAIKTGKTVQDVVMGIKTSNVDHTVWININSTPIFKEETSEIDYVYSTFDDITQQLQWQSTLKESEERFRSLANAAPTLIWIADTTKNCIWFNHTWLEYTGRTLEQESGFGFTEGVYPDDIQPCFEIYNLHFDAKQSFNMEYRLRGSDGEFRWFIDIGKPRFDEHGEFCGYIGMLTDINERKKLEEIMRFYQFSLNHSSEEVFWINKDGQLLDANQAACIKLGYSEAEIKQLTVPDIDPNVTLDNWSDHWHQLKQKKTLRFESMQKKRNGKTFPTEIVANYFEYESKEYSCSFVRDITEQKALEQRLKEKTDYLNTILNSEPECVKVVAADGSLLDMNQAGLKLLEVESVEEAKEFGLINFVLPEFRPLFQKLHHETFQGKSATLQFILQGKHGVQRWVDTHAAPLFDENGNVKALVGVTRDITERVKLQKELENQARKDFLTDLPNRRYFLVLAEQELNHAQRYSKPLSILMMDIDFFKSINDRCGHKSGDLVLQKLAKVCVQLLRDVDVIGRMGGEEFAILLPETPGTFSLDVAERIRHALENVEVVVEQHSAPLKFTVSIGASTLDNREVTVDKLLQEADAALYQAKNSGKNKVIAFFKGVQAILYS